MGGEPSPQVVCSDSVGEQPGLPWSCEHGDDSQLSSVLGGEAGSQVRVALQEFFVGLPCGVREGASDPLVVPDTAADYHLQFGATERFLAKSDVKSHFAPWFETCQQLWRRSTHPRT